MANLIYYYGTMEAGKTTKLLMDHYNYCKNQKKVILTKPSIDTKGNNMVVSRIGHQIEADFTINAEESLLQDAYLDQFLNCDVIMIDEAQFLNPKQVDELWYLAHLADIPVVAYGLKVNFLGHLFDGSAELCAKADEIRELTINCECGKLASQNVRLVNGHYSFDGPEVIIDGENAEVKYVPMCSDCIIKKVILPTHPECQYLLSKIKVNSQSKCNWQN